MFCLRSQVIEKVRTTRSTWPDSSADSRWLASTTCRSMRSGSPKIRRAISRARSMSKPSSSTGRGIAVAEHEGVLVDADDEPSALFDGRHRRPRWHGTRRRLRAGPQAGFGVAAVRFRRLRSVRDLLCASRSHRCGGDRHGRRWRRRRTTAGHGQGDCGQCRHDPRAHRNSRRRGHSPTTAASRGRRHQDQRRRRGPREVAPGVGHVVAHGGSGLFDRVAQARLDDGELCARCAGVGAERLGDRGRVVAGTVGIHLLAMAGDPLLDGLACRRASWCRCGRRGRRCVRRRTSRWR